jgi:hypothetical protein
LELAIEKLPGVRITSNRRFIADFETHKNVKNPKNSKKIKKIKLFFIEFEN